MPAGWSVLHEDPAFWTQYPNFEVPAARAPRACICETQAKRQCGIFFQVATSITAGPNVPIAEERQDDNIAPPTAEIIIQMKSRNRLEPMNDSSPARGAVL